MKKIKNIRFSKKELNKLIIYPDKNANKYSRGTCFIVAGSVMYPGAAILCAKAANRFGAGYIKLYTCPENVKAAAFTMPSCVCAPINDLEIPKEFIENKPFAFVVGPGFVPNIIENDDLLCRILKTSKAPVVIDGGALSSIAAKNVREAIAKRAKDKLDTILTPHMGEAEKIYECFAKKAKLKQIDLAKELAVLTGATIVLKGPNTYVCNSSFLYLMNSGTSALAKAGSGDVLAGILGAILCQNKISAFEACVLATNLHAQAGNLAAKEFGDAFVISEDLI